ncbi:glycine-rich RNA-binding protein 3, mitochondrial-like [Salvia splendens]|uniref:glycine-rich RNA-binding protein 3, mitochondrial-like n=1 Tax=Salvia splendens TaxID=180675 RepID=UPI001C27F6E9|nr:glycine-rich RNA-binding protein 3, mitochondrial-like [Salvia splendens]
MALFRKAATILGRTVSSRINHETSVSNLSIFQAIRCMSSSKVFVGGLSYNIDDQSLGESFDKYGEVIDAKVIVDRETGRSRGFGFVTFASAEEASAAIQALDQQELHGRQVKVNYANDRPRGGFGGGGGYGEGGGYGGGGYGGGGGGYGGSGSGGGGYGGSSGYGGSGGGSFGGEADTGGYHAAGESQSGGGVTRGFGGDSGSYGSGAADGGFGGGEASYRDDDTRNNFADRRG